MMWQKNLLLLALGLMLFYAASMCRLFKTVRREWTSPEEIQTVMPLSQPSESISQGDFLDSTVEGQLPDTFQAVLKNYSVVPFSDVKIVFVLTYYRAGAVFT
uniref:Putative secreted protein n=1 Tax=Amblyomma cajennense TaxID=34607 RepID=A0A023FSI8_AMBCJ